MSNDKIKISGKRIKDIKGLQKEFENLGFTKIENKAGILKIEKNKGEDINGKPFFDYGAEFREDLIVFSYSIVSGKSILLRKMELMPTILNILEIASNYYNLKVGEIFSLVKEILNESTKVMDRESLDAYANFKEIEGKYKDLKIKYDELTRSSETNAKILLDSEQKIEEQRRELSKISTISDELLREMLFAWIKAHNGSIEIREFSKAHSVPISKIEEGLNGLIQLGYIKRRLE